MDSKIVFNCVRKIKEKADTRRGNRSIFKTKDFAGFLKHSKYEDSSAGKIDWSMLGRRMQHAVNRYLKLNYCKKVFFPHPFICMRRFNNDKVGNRKS